IDPSPSVSRELVTYLREGVWHIWIGFDHILFLLSLLVPAVHHYADAPRRTMRDASLDVVKTVTAFTVAHSITLALAALGLIELPSRLVESAIAASVLVAALNNLVPVVTRRIWSIAFAFGLIHGLGFANVLKDFGLPSTGLVRALFAFNVGVELGQLAIVLLFLPLAYGMREKWLYRVGVLRGGSCAIALIATVWLLESAARVRVWGRTSGFSHSA